MLLVVVVNGKVLGTCLLGEFCDDLPSALQITTI